MRAGGTIRAAGSHTAPRGKGPIAHLDRARALTLLCIVLVAAAAGGGTGGFVAWRVAGHRAPAAAQTASAGPAAAAGSGRAAVERTLAAVVTIVADGPERRDASGRVSQTRSLGSGVVIDAGGFVATNAHVIAGAASVFVVLPSGEQRPAQLVASDAPYTDLAVVRIPATGLRAASYGDASALRPGDAVYTVTAAPFATGNSVAAGVVSATERSWPRNGVVLEHLIQTDAAVNHGDSGGALLNARGELVGLVTTLVERDPLGRAVNGVAFAQASNAVRPIVESIVRTGRYPRPRLGIEVPGTGHAEVTPELVQQRKLPVDAGALVLAVPPGSPAATAGLRVDDLIVRVNGTAVTLDVPLVNLLARLRPGERAVLDVVRGGTPLTVNVTPVQE